MLGQAQHRVAVGPGPVADDDGGPFSAAEELDGARQLVSGRRDRGGRQPTSARTRGRVVAEYLAQLRVTIDALGHADPESLSDEALADLVDVYRRWRAEG